MLLSGVECATCINSALICSVNFISFPGVIILSSLGKGLFSEYNDLTIFSVNDVR